MILREGVSSRVADIESSVIEFDGFIMADIPGIIGGASEGKGLGLAFLKHIERTKILLFMLDLAHPSMDVKEQFAALKTELGKFSSDSRACALLLLNYLEKGLQPEAFLRTYRFADRKTIPYCGCR